MFAKKMSCTDNISFNCFSLSQQKYKYGNLAFIIVLLQYFSKNNQYLVSEKTGREIIGNKFSFTACL